MKKVKFYIRCGIVGLINPYWINSCLVFDGWNIYKCNATEIVGDMTFTEINI